VPVYRASATILLKSSQEQSVSKSDLMEGFGLSPEVRNIENQTFIIKSKKTIRKAIDRLDFGVEYFRHGRLKDTEIYNQTPFIVEFDSTHPQLLNVPFYIFCEDPQTVTIELLTEGSSRHIFKESKNAGYSGPVNYTQTIKWDEWVSTPNFSFRLKKISEQVCSPGVKHFFKFQSHDRIAGMFRGRLGVGAYREGSSIMNISVSGTSPGKLTRFLEELCQVIMEHSLERKNDMATRSLAFIKSQLETVSDSLKVVQDEMLAFRKSNRFMVPSEYSQKILDDYFEEEQNLQLLRVKKDYYNLIKDKLANNPQSEDFLLPAVSEDNNGLVNQLVLQLFTLKEEYDLLSKEADSTNPYLNTLSSKISITKENLNGAINQVLNNIDIQEKELRNKLKKAILEINELPDLEKEYYDIDRNYKLNDAIYTFLLQKHSENQIAKASNTPDNEVIDSPYVSGILSPDRKGNYSKALILALLIPAGIIVLREWLNTKVRGKEDLESLSPSVPMMGVVMHNKTEIQDLVHEQPHSVITEAFRSLRTKIKFMSCEHPSKVITVTSTNTGEGKTFCAQNMAAVFSISGKKTALLGFDMRKPRLSELYQLDNQTGLSNLLTNQASFEDILYETNHKNLYILPAGPIPPNPSELISSENTTRLFQQLREQFEVIIIDSPPVGLVADARMLMDYADCHLFVVRANYTNKEHMGYTINNLLAENIKNLGLILNDVSHKDKGYGYYSAEYYG
jgi:capsular exopolysaccharide synthesis family protein